jgi:hypothetical protein
VGARAGERACGDADILGAAAAMSTRGRKRKQRGWGNAGAISGGAITSLPLATTTAAAHELGDGGCLSEKREQKEIS